MRGFSCPNCGKRQKTKLKSPSKASLPCIECGKSLLAKLEKGKLTVIVDAGGGSGTK